MHRCQKGASLAQIGTGLARIPRAYLFEKEFAPLRNAVEIPTEPHRLPPPARKTGQNSVSGWNAKTRRGPAVATLGRAYAICRAHPLGKNGMW
jgi:hypothetical protein